MHDLMDPFREYFRICYIEFPGSRRNPQPVENGTYSSFFLENLGPLKKHLGASRFHLLAHLSSAPLALDIAAHQPDSIASLILIEPDLCLADRFSKRSTKSKLHDSHEQSDRDGLILSVLQELWESKLPAEHAKGLAKILAPGLNPETLCHDLLYCRNRISYPKLSREKTPALIFYSRDGSDYAHRDALYLQAALPAAESAAIEKGGAWAPWFGGSWFANKLLSFKRTGEGKNRPAPRRRSRTLSGQPLGWMVAVFAILAVGLTGGLNLLRFQPDFMSQVISPLLAGALPILWFLIPKKINPIPFFRFRGFSLRTVLLPLAVGTLLGIFFRSLLLTVGDVSLPAFLPPSFVAVVPTNEGRLFQLAGMAVLSLFVFGVAENLWVLRRSRLQILMPTLLFTLLPPSFPDILWRLPVGFAAAILFAGSLSIFSPLFLLAGFAAVSKLPLPLGLVPLSWQSYQGVTATIGVLAAAILLAVFLGASGKPVPPEDLYFSRTINKDNRLYRWEPGLGIVMVIFSLIAAGALIFGFIAA
jgi:pimeloyl-ACP methyl ester carboxylesterase